MAAESWRNPNKASAFACGHRKERKRKTVEVVVEARPRIGLNREAGSYFSALVSRRYSRLQAARLHLSRMKRRRGAAPTPRAGMKAFICGAFLLNESSPVSNGRFHYAFVDRLDIGDERNGDIRFNRFRALPRVHPPSGFLGALLWNRGLLPNPGPKLDVQRKKAAPKDNTRAAWILFALA